jgi:hypothetical protein
MYIFQLKRKPNVDFSYGMYRGFIIQAISKKDCIKVLQKAMKPQNPSLWNKNHDDSRYEDDFELSEWNIKEIGISHREGRSKVLEYNYCNH